MLLALEGVAGSGKSTLRNRVLIAAADEGISVGHIGQFSWLSLPATRTIISLRAGRRDHAVEQAQNAVRADLKLHARYNLMPALTRGPVVADRLTLSTACLLALLHNRPVATHVRQLADETAARADLTVLLTTDPTLCQTRLLGRVTARRFGDDLPTAGHLAELYDQAATAWADATGLPVLRRPSASRSDLDVLSAACFDWLREVSQPSAPT
jgi:thymidylate kinase